MINRLVVNSFESIGTCARANRKRCEPRPVWWRGKARVAGGQTGRGCLFRALFFGYFLFGEVKESNNYISDKSTTPPSGHPSFKRRGNFCTTMSQYCSALHLKHIITSVFLQIFLQRCCNFSASGVRMA
jgi:hypothetical protein